MSQLVFRCPQTGKEFDSGFQAEPGEILSLPRDAKIRLNCRICGEFHELKFADAVVRDGQAAKF